MAEGWVRALKGDQIEPYSAGIEKHGLDPKALKVMAEAGVDIGDHRSKTLEELPVKEFDYVVTVCDGAAKSCPLMEGKAKVIHVSFDDPPKLAKLSRNEKEALDHYRRVRDEIRAFIATLPEGLNPDHPSYKENRRRYTRDGYWP
jgi:arsenate reductase